MPISSRCAGAPAWASAFLGVKRMGSCKQCVAWQFGACRNEDYCLPERLSLMEAATDLAREKGHDLGEFERVTEGHSAFRAVCQHCGRSVSIDVNPALGEKDLFGEAIVEPCDAAA